MPQLVPFYFINQVTFTFAILVGLIYVFSKYILPRLLRLFLCRMFISRLSNTKGANYNSNLYNIRRTQNLNKPTGIRFFSTERHVMNSNKLGTYDESKQNSLVSLNPNYVTGFSDGEGCFYIKFTRSNNLSGWVVQPVFCIELHIKYLALIQIIQSYFGVGTILINQKKIQLLCPSSQ
jgi:F-type H+-transporting ATPase subunit 8